MLHSLKLSYFYGKTVGS